VKPDEAPHGIFSIRAPLVQPPGGGGVTYNPYANMHDPVEAHVEWLTTSGYQIRGIIHIGANDGQELAWYVTKNYRPILAFEPHPQAFEELKKRYWNHALIWNLALGSETGKTRLFVPEDGDTEKSSKYKAIPTEGHEWTSVPVNNSVEVPLIRFDVWAYKGGIDLTPFNVVVIDVQGMELEVLQGFGIYLRMFDFLVVECSRVPVYDGEASAQQVIDWLDQADFEPISPIEDHNDIFFRRNGIEPQS
jgi:FkbM family methyltransferase